MNDPRRPGEADDDTPLDAEALLARDALRDLPPVTAEPAYRAGLKAAFTSGELAGHATAGQASARDVASTDAATERERSLLPLPTPGRHRLWTGMAVAAALVIAVTTGVLNQGPAWRVAAVRGGGSILLDGHAHSVADASLIGRRVPPGVRVEVSNGAELDLRADGVLSMQFTGGTDLILPPSPPRWFGRRTALHVQQGELRVTTGPAFPGAQLEITTPDAMIAVTGTTFAVILERTGTCVCVLEGTVGVGPRGTSPAPVSSGHLRYVFRDGRPPADTTMREVEKVKLAAFRATSMEGLERATP